MPDPEQNREDLEDLARERGADLFGVAEVSNLRHTFHPSLDGLASGLPLGISMGIRLADTIIGDIADRPTLIYKHQYKAANYALDQIALRLTEELQRRGFRALPIPASQVVDWDRHLGHLSHKAVAKQAGLGWIGRSGLLVNQLHGGRVRYVSLLTDCPLPSDEQGAGECGECMRCAEACPAGAISGGGYDMPKCLAKLKEFSRERGMGVHICGVCVKACPVEDKGEMANHPSPHRSWAKWRKGIGL